MHSLTAGIDEAGRGPILGPMVMACVVLDEAHAPALAEAGVMDSKQFGAGPKAHAARQALVPRILEVCVHATLEVVEVEEIDRRTRCHQLNHLEQERAALMLDRAPAVGRIIADGERLFAPLRRRYPHLIATNKAEAEHVAVAAASILAKTRRDELWLSIAERYAPEFGELGGFGYMNDATRRFLRAYCARYRRIPPEGRRSWPWDFVADLLPDGELPVRQPSLF